MPRFDLAALFVPRRPEPKAARPTVDLPDLERLLRDRLRREHTAEEATAAVLAFRADAPDDTVARAASQAEELAALPVPDDQLDQILVLDLGSGYWPPRLGQDIRTWLRDIARLLRDD